MTKYILGIDTTFHSTGIGLVDKNGNVILNEIIHTDFSDESDVKFLNFHLENVLTLIKPVFGKYSKDIFLISASSQEGPFHSMPVGAIIANALSYLFNKKLIGVSHQIAHLHANWLNRKEKDFLFPIISLNMSGAHSNIYLITNPWKTEKVAEINWQDNQERFSGLGALFDIICYSMNLHIKKGEGGSCLEKLALSGKPTYKKELGDLIIQKENDNFNFKDADIYISQKLRKLNYHSLKEKDREVFQKNFSSSILNALFNLLTSILLQLTEETRAKEVHLAGGVAMNTILQSKLSSSCAKYSMGLKFPLKPEFCYDNGAMVAMSGYYKWKRASLSQKKGSDFLTILPSSWYYKYYAKNFVK